MKAELLPRRGRLEGLAFGSGTIVLLGLAALAVPTFLTLANEHWATDAGAHGPLVIATGAWLIWRRLKEFSQSLERGNIGIVAGMLMVALVFYIFGRAFDYLSLQATGFYISALAALYDSYGSRLLRHLWFPLLYLAFVLPVPGWVIDTSTAPLKEVASWATTEGLQLVGVPITREGVILFVAQYQLLVEDACAGMNAIMGLIALGLFYSYLVHGPSWCRALILTLFVLPIAIIANVVRIVLLVLITYWYGDEAAQGYLHGAAGLVMFASALLLVFLTDSLLSYFRPVRRAR